KPSPGSDIPRQRPPPSTDEQAPVRDRADGGLLSFLGSTASNCGGITVSISDRVHLASAPSPRQLAGQGEGTAIPLSESAGGSAGSGVGEPSFLARHGG